MMTEEEIAFLAYTAGFFDADGTTGVYWHKDPTCLRGMRSHLQAHIVQKLWMPIFKEWHNRWGGSLLCDNQGRWRWQVSSNKAASFLTDILPWVRKKHAQAKLGLEFQKRVGAQHRGKSHPMSDTEFKWQVAVAKTLKRMKKGEGP